MRSFTLEGMGLHAGNHSALSSCSSCVRGTHALLTALAFSAAAAIVRVRPAFAGEGRYFVKVPPGAPLQSARLPAACSHAVA